MPKTRTVLISATLLAILAVSGSAAARQDIVDARGWPTYDAVKQDGCTAQVRGNGKIYRVQGQGFAPGAAVYVHLVNDGIKPLDYRDTADLSGNWSRYYVPFLWHHQGETVQVNVTSGECSLDLTFDWQRQDPNS
ncbi:hypothetical protein GRI89_04205 [Altererythrobacter salegens]|uniref:Secreted protein n=1 Tax=Croceibacterium salegens TaxID=1737568 RepID=A0A6I4SS89_9SPHN|nr:hypothetical protein [Croceibacterium salegens]MXO58743.1 hypothetical protein [Croceibacterium salegens]